MVGYDDLRPQVASHLHLPAGRDPAVDRNDQPRPAGDDLADGLFVEAVTLLEAVGDVVVDVRISHPQDPPQDGCAGDAVDVVVAVDDDLAALLDRLADQVGGPLGAVEGLGRQQVAELGVEEGPGLFDVREAAVA